MGRYWKVAIGLTAFSLAILGAAQQAAAVTWQSPVRVSSAGEAAYIGPRIATDANGDMVVAWLKVASFGTCPCTVRAAYRPAGGAFGAPVSVSPTMSGSASPQQILLAMDSKGDAIVAWNGGQNPSDSSLYDTAYAAIRPAGGSWGTPQALVAPSGQNEVGVSVDAIAMDASGDAIAGVTGEQPYTGAGASAGDQTIDAEVVTRPAGGSFDSAHPQVLTDGTHTGYLRALGMSSDGKAVVAIRSDVDDESQPTTPQPNSLIVMSSASPGAPFGSAHTLETVTPQSIGGFPQVDTGSISEPNAAINDAGDYVVIYDRDDPNGQQFSFNGTPKVSINGGAATSLLPSGVTSAAATSVVIDSTGHIVVLLNDGQGGTYESIGTPGGGMGTPTSLSLPTATSFTNASDEANANGEILYAFDAAGTNQTDVDASVGSATGTFPSPSTVASNDDGFSFGASGAIDRAGDAGVAWLGGSSELEVHVALTAGGGTTGSTKHTLTVTRSGAGSGLVTSSPAGISCGASCAHPFAAGTKVTLTAHPAAGSRFAGWSGACSGSGQCAVTLNANESVKATFVRIPPPTTALTNASVSSKHHRATFSFKGTGGVGRLHFQCKLDTAAWKTCSSPTTYKHLKRGKHLFEARAVDARGKADATPAKKHFRI